MRLGFRRQRAGKPVKFAVQNFLYVVCCPIGTREHGGGKGTVTPLLKVKVRIPPPAGLFIDPPWQKKNLTPLLSKNFFPWYI